MQYFGERKKSIWKIWEPAGIRTQDLLISSQTLIPIATGPLCRGAEYWLLVAAKFRSPSQILQFLSLSRVYPRAEIPCGQGCGLMWIACTSTLSEMLSPSTTLASSTIIPQWPLMPMALCIITTHTAGYKCWYLPGWILDFFWGFLSLCKVLHQK